MYIPHLSEEQLKKLRKATRRAGRDAKMYSKSNEAIAIRLTVVNHVKEK